MYCYYLIQEVFRYTIVSCDCASISEFDRLCARDAICRIAPRARLYGILRCEKASLVNWDQDVTS